MLAGNPRLAQAFGSREESQPDVLKMPRILQSAWGVRQEKLPCPGVPNLRETERFGVSAAALCPGASAGDVHSGVLARGWNSEHLCPSLLPLLGPRFSLGLQVEVGPYCIPMEEQKGAELVPQSPRGVNLFGTFCRPKKGDQGLEGVSHSNK